MRVKVLGITALGLSLLVFAATDANAGRRVRTFGDQPDQKEQQQKPGKRGEKSFKELVKDKVEIEGLFTFYHDTTDNSVLMAIQPEQLDKIYLCSETRAAAEGAFFDNGSMAGQFPFYFKRVGENIMLMEKNLRLQADTASAVYEAVKKSISDHLWESTKILAEKNDSTATILIDPSDLFIRDAQNLSYYLGQSAKLGVRFDKKNSYFEMIKSFPKNSELAVRLHYQSSKPVSATTMQNPYSMFHIYRYSLLEIPESDYVPRRADDRVGYFTTMYMDYTDMDRNSPYVRYINRWNLKKENPDARISDPVKPIVFWIENTWPEEYRDAVAEGIEFWNDAYEDIGFRNAIVAKQMPDTASWDPADSRYNVVQWMVMPGGGYAVGPSHANPYTGELYDADIRVSADFLRYMFNNMEYFIQPTAYDGSIPEEEDPLKEMKEFNRHNAQYFCDYQSESAKEAMFGLTYSLAAHGDLADKDSLTRAYVHSYLVELVAHEVGHTLGFRHNYKASSIYPLEKLYDKNFTRENSTSGTVMDYCPPILAGPGQEQGEFYASTPGPYDRWVIEYGYSDFGAETPEEEEAELVRIAGKAGDPLLVYGTDEDAFGTSTKGIDPLCLTFDHGDDPIKYCNHKIKLTRHLWSTAADEFTTEGEGYQRVLRAFNAGWRSYYETAGFVVRQIAGIHHNRYHVGDHDGDPFDPVSAEHQRRAMQFLTEHIFAADAFDISDDLANKLQPERAWDFTGSVYAMPQIDYPIHTQWLAVQNSTLNRLYSPLLLGRLQNNVERIGPNEEAYTMYDMFTDARRAIWGEVVDGANVNSYRRQLQLLHLKRIVQIYLLESPVFPADARTLAANDLDILETAIGRQLDNGNLDGMTRAHFKEVLRQIDAAQSASRNYVGN